MLACTCCAPRLTNPATGWKSIFAFGLRVQPINSLTKEESQHALPWFVQLIVENHDLHVRQRCQNENDLQSGTTEACTTLRLSITRDKT
jgi:hypothetical protein